MQSSRRIAAFKIVRYHEMVRTIGEDKSEQKVIDDIAELGWHCLHIMAEGDEVEYSFTVGLFQSFGHPELIVFGLPSTISHKILSIAADAAKSGSPIDLAQPTDALLNNYACCFAEVSPSKYHEYVGYARWYYQGNGFPLFQIVWPSRFGLFPWDHQATAEFRAAQPIIAHAPSGT
jgi:hypothetical protein